LTVLVAIQVFVVGLYLPPVVSLVPPQMIISVPVQTAVCPIRASGALVMLVAVHVSVVGLYLPPVLNSVGYTHPPQTIISVSVHTAV
jgi:hypothetical protein